MEISRKQIIVVAFIGLTITLLAIFNRKINLAGLATGNVTATASHPRLWITPSDLPRLQSWATMANPIYAQGLSKTVAYAINDYNTAFFPGGQPNPNWPDSGGVTWPNKVTEQYSMLFAFMSLVDPDPVIRAQHAERARNLLMYAINEAAKGHLKDAPFRDPVFATYDRGRAYFEGFPLTVDWIYNAVGTNGNPVLSASDKQTIRTVFMMWAADCNTTTINSFALTKTDPTSLLANPVKLRTAANNYYSGRTRNQILLSLAIDAADDPPIDPNQAATQPGNSLRSYLYEATSKWLLAQYAMYETPQNLAQNLKISAAALGKASGGLSAEGFMYGECLAFVRSGLLGLTTAGYNDPALIGPQAGLIDNSYWERHVDTFIQSLTPASWVPAAPNAWMGQVYGAAAFGDTHFAYVHATHFEIFGQIGLYAYLTGNTALLNKARWVAVEALAGGASALFQRAAPTYGAIGTDAILYFLLFDPTDPTALNPPDPRPALPLAFYDRGLGRLVMRTDWSANATLFDYKCSWATINHQNADCNQFELYRNGEWLTKEHTNYDNWGIGQTSDYHNTLSLENDVPASIVWGETFIQRGSQHTNGGAVGDPTVVTSMGNGYAFAQGDATNLYNHKEYNPANWSNDIQHASRSLVWLKPDYVVIYDRAKSKTANRFKRFNLNFVNVPTVNGHNVHLVTPHAQNVYLQSLLPANATLTVSAIEPMNTSAALEPTNWRLVVEAQNGPADVRFLHVLQGADANQLMEVATHIQSNDGSYEGAVVNHTAVLFQTTLGPTATSLSYVVPLGVKSQIVSGLAPQSGYDLQTQEVAGGTQVTIVAGGSYVTDNAGVLLVNQDTSPTSLTLTPASLAMAAAGGPGSVSISAFAGMNWSAVSQAPWITLTGLTQGSGDGLLNYTVQPNTLTNSRTGTIDVGGQTHLITQQGLVCHPSLSSTSVSLAATSATGNVNLSIEPGCPWNAASNISWTGLGRNNGTGSTSLLYTVQANSGAARSGTMTIAGLNFTVNQAGTSSNPVTTTPTCTYAFTVTSKQIAAGPATGGTTFKVQNGCDISVVSSDLSWLKASTTMAKDNTGNYLGSLQFTATANNSSQSRTGTITIAGKYPYTVTQLGQGKSCIYNINPNLQDVGLNGGNYTFKIASGTPSNCTWQATTNDNWITVTGKSSGSGSGGTISYTVAPSNSQRTGTISLGGQKLLINQQ